MMQEREAATRAALSVEALGPANQAAWDAYVHTAADGLPLQLSGWAKVLARTYGYENLFLLARRGQQVAGVLPLFVVPSRLTGRRAMTLPGGLCAADEQVATALLAQGWELAGARGLSRLVVQDSRQVWTAAQTSASDHVTWRVPLQAAEEEQWAWLDGNIRRQVRKARKNGLESEVDHHGKLLGEFYELFSRFTHGAGTPVFGQPFLQNIVATFPGGFNIALIRHEGRAIAGYFQLQMSDTIYGMWGAALPETLSLRPAYLALWEIMADGIAHGYSFLDMGRSPAGSNASKFKGQWGGTEAPIYQLTMHDGNQSAPTNVTDQVQSDQRFQLFMQVWPRLPLTVTNYMGPMLRRHIPFA